MCDEIVVCFYYYCFYFVVFFCSPEVCVPLANMREMETNKTKDLERNKTSPMLRALCVWLPAFLTSLTVGIRARATRRSIIHFSFMDLSRVYLDPAVHVRMLNKHLLTEKSTMIDCTNLVTIETIGYHIRASICHIKPSPPKVLGQQGHLPDFW